MDKHYIAQRLKKYLFFISIIFIVLTTSHLIYSYIYNDAKETAIKRSKNSNILALRKVTLAPIPIPLRNLKLEISFFDKVFTAL